MKIKRVQTIRFNDQQVELLTQALDEKSAASTQLKELIFSSLNSENSATDLEKVVSVLGSLMDRLGAVERRLGSIDSVAASVAKIEDYLSQISEENNV